MSASSDHDQTLSSSDESEGEAEEGDILSSSEELSDSEVVDDPGNERPSVSHSPPQLSPKLPSRPSWNGKTLFPPPRMSTKNPSTAWQFGGLHLHFPW